MTFPSPPAPHTRRRSSWLVPAAYAFILEAGLFLAMLYFNERTPIDSPSVGWVLLLTQLPGALAGQVVLAQFAERNQIVVVIAYVVIFGVQWLMYFFVIAMFRAAVGLVRRRRFPLRA